MLDLPGFRCPCCGGSRFRDAGFGVLVCMSYIDMSMPPGLFGNAGWIHGGGACGFRVDRFAAPLASRSTPAPEPAGARICASCGRSRAGRRGGYLCEACEADQRGGREQAARLAASRRRDAASEARRRLATCECAVELKAVLAESVDLELTDVRAAWLRVLARHAWPAAYELVALEGRRTGLAAWSTERGCRGVWRESSQRRVRAWPVPAALDRRRDAWLDADGNLWQQRPDWSYLRFRSREEQRTPENRFKRFDEPGHARAVLARGGRVDVRACAKAGQPGFNRVEGGVPIYHSPLRDALVYPRAVAIVLRALTAGERRDA